MRHTAYVITRDDRKICTLDATESAREFVTRCPGTVAAKCHMIPIDAGDNLIGKDGWQYPFESHKDHDVSRCYIDADKSAGLVHIDGTLDAESLERLAAYLRSA